ncbi:MAG: lysylphosphatidylglycerol synthase transmembrane domain-containing protein [Chitinophagaceae bacterium]
MQKKISTILQYLVFLALGLLLVWLSVKDIDAESWQQIRHSLQEAKFVLFIPVFAILLFSHYIRALRWRLLMEPLGYRPDKANTFFAVMIGYLANQVFPRLGEVLKCTLLARYEKIPADKLIGTIILERLIDGFCLLAVFGITLAIQPGLYSQLVAQVFQPDSVSSESAGWTAYLPLILLLLLLLAIGIWMWVKKKSISDILAVLRKIAARIWLGLTTIRHLKSRGSFLIYTLIIWTCYLAGGYIGFQALQETSGYGIKEAFTVLSAGSIGMIITPGGIGGYALLIERTMMLYGLSQPIAAAFGWLLWISQTLIVLLGGLTSFALLPWHNKRRRASVG